MTDRAEASVAVEAVVRESYDRLVAYLARSTGDIAAAEDALGDAIAAALETWPRTGAPHRPGSWLLTVAKRRLIGDARKHRTADRALPTLSMLDEGRDELGPTTPEDIPDHRLQLLYACAHPAIDVRMHAPLMLQAVLRLDAARIASSFLTSPATMGQRLARAKSKIRDANIPFEIPRREELPARTRSVLDAVYAAYGTGWDDPDGSDRKRRGLTDEALHLGRLIVELQPDDAEAHGLMALMLHTAARSGARRLDGDFVPLDHQDVSLWSRSLMGEAERHLGVAAAMRSIGPYQLQAAIQSLHNRRALTGTTDWQAISTLYDGLVDLAPSVGAQVARAAAHARADGAAVGLDLLDGIEPTLVRSYQPYWATRAHVLRQAGDERVAMQAAARAIGLTTDPAVRAHLMSTYDIRGRTTT